VANITIDSNVFHWLFDYREENNQDRHVNALLGRIIAKSIRLHTDMQGFIRQEYDNRIRRLILSKHDCTNEVQLLRYFMDNGNHDEVDTSPHKALKRAIRQIIRGGPQTVDRSFVVLACISRVPLISNNTMHINRHEDRLVKCAKAQGYNLIIWTSREAQV
jgi:hypothetical protein